MFDLLDLPDLKLLNQLARIYPDLDISGLQTLLLLLRTGTETELWLDRFLADHDLSLRRFLVLILLLRNPEGLGAGQLAASTGVSGPTISGVLDTLERQELATRTINPFDHRAKIVLLAEKGKELLNRLLPPHYRRVARVMKALDEDERSELQRMLRKISSALEKE